MKPAKGKVGLAVRMWFSRIVNGESWSEYVLKRVGLPGVGKRAHGEVMMGVRMWFSRRVVKALSPYEYVQNIARDDRIT